MLISHSHCCHRFMCVTSLCLKRLQCIWALLSPPPQWPRPDASFSGEGNYSSVTVMAIESGWHVRLRNENLSLGRLVGYLHFVNGYCPYCLIWFFRSSIFGENCMTVASFPAWIWQSHMQKLSRDTGLMHLMLPLWYKYLPLRRRPISQDMHRSTCGPLGGMHIHVMFLLYLSPTCALSTYAACWEAIMPCGIWDALFSHK